MEAIREMWLFFTSQVSRIGLNDIIDIILVGILLFYLIRFARDRRASKLGIGIFLVFVIYILSELFNLNTIKFLFENVFQVGVIALIIVFQPELRSMLDSFAARSLSFSRSKSANISEAEKMVENVCEAARELSKGQVGALIAIERTSPLGDYKKSGSKINADVSSILLRNIFFYKSPLHDGAVIITNYRIDSAGCFLPLSMNSDIIKELGTRHRAAIGLSENSDAIVVVVSEENGIISVANNGELIRDFSYESLKEYLTGIFVEDNDSRRFGLFKKKKSQQEENAKSVSGGEEK